MDESSTLERWFEQGSPAQRQRAAIVIERRKGASITAIALRLRVHRDTVRRWLARHRRNGLAGLMHGNAHRERRRKFDEAACLAIREVACQDPRVLGENFAVWSLYKLRRHLLRAEVVKGISVERLRQLLERSGGRPPGWRQRLPERLALDAEVAARLQAMEGTAGLRERAAIILAAAEGKPVKAIAVDLMTSGNTVRRWIWRFLASGITALETAPLRGQPVKFPREIRAKIAEVAGRTPRNVGLPREAWSLSSLRAYLVSAGIVSGISVEWLRQIVRQEASSSQPKRARMKGSPSVAQPSPVTRFGARTRAARSGSEFSELARASPAMARSRIARRTAASSAR
jgi:transposase